MPIVGSPTVVLWRDESDTQAFAARLAARPAIRDAFIALHGDLGAGKTTFVRHLLRAMGAQGRIKSPTYTLAEPYELPQCMAWHFDFYRFNDPREWEDAGLRDIFGQPGLKLAEWPEKAQGLLPVPDVTMHLRLLLDGTREVRCEPGTARGVELLA